MIQIVQKNSNQIQRYKLGWICIRCQPQSNYFDTGYFIEVQTCIKCVTIDSMKFPSLKSKILYSKWPFNHVNVSFIFQVSSSPLTALKPQLPSLTPSLGKLYKESLIGHVVGWPAEAVERAAQRVNDDHNNICNLGITKVSAELKMARSLVRLAEIQATLQEQRILFLRQQTLDLENMKTRPGNSALLLPSCSPTNVNNHQWYTEERKKTMNPFENSVT